MKTTTKQSSLKAVLTLLLLLVTSARVWANDAPLGYVDRCIGHQGSIYLNIWALDKDNYEARVTIHVYLYQDGQQKYFYNLGPTDLYRDDTVNPQYAGYHKMQRYIDVPVAGTYNVAVYALDTEGGTNTLLKHSWNGSPYPSTVDVTTSSPYTVTYNANGGSGAPAATTKSYGIDLTLSTTYPTRSGYHFMGWNTAANGSGTSYAAGATYTGDANLTLYAQWEANDLPGNGTVADPYIMRTTAGWNTFACSVNSGTETYEGKTVMLATDITVSMMVGTGSNYSNIGNLFRGTFDGCGHTLHLNIQGGNSEGAAPFHYIGGATIKNVKTTGTVSGANHCSGLVGFAASNTTNTIQSCWVDADITCTTTHAGGILGWAYCATVRDCLFSGSLTGSSSYTGIIYGWGDDLGNGTTHTIINCLADGTYTNCGGIHMLVRYRGTDSVTNCYKTQNVGSSGTYTTATGETLRALLGDGWEVRSGNVVPKMVNSLEVPYRAYNTGTKTFETLTTDNFTAVTTATTTMGTANTETWYVANSNASVSSRITVNGTVHLILCDGATLTVNGGIAVSAGNALYIYSQSSGTGQLIADATGLNGSAGIGGGSSVGSITIHGGNITATGGEWSAGIGGGTNGGGGSITIYGGNVEGIGWRVNNNGNAVGIGRGSSGAAVAIQAHELRLQYYENGWQDVTYSQRASTLEKLRVRFFPCTEHSYSDGQCTLCGKYQWYTVTYNGNGNTGGSVPTDNTHYATNGTGTVTVRGNTGNLVRTGYTFTGWNTAADGSGTDYAANATFTIYENVTLYAQWVETNPSPQNLNVTTDGITATVTWSGIATSYNISINGTVTNNVTSPYTFDVEPSSTYEVMVQADYGTDGVSFWTAVYRFTTPVIIEYTLNDSYGDGWNGNAIIISDNCGVVETLTLGNGSSDSGTFTLPGDYYQFVWQTGNYSNETSFTLIVNGVTLYTNQAGNALSYGQVLYTFGTATDMMPRPTGLTTGTLGTREVRLSWTENGTATAWEVCVNGDENNPIAANSNPFTLTGLTPETSYTVKVRATDGYIESCWSDAVSFTTAVACAKPEDLDQNNITYTTADVSWTGTSDSYVVQYGTWTQVGADHITTATLTPYTFDLSGFSGMGTVAIRHYNVTDMFRMNVDDIVVKDATGATVYSQDFESGSIPSDMSNIDLDGDGNVWYIWSQSNVNGSCGVTSASWTENDGALTPDNWLILPDVQLGGSITFKAVGQDESAVSENFGVYVIADNQFTQAYSGTTTSCQLTGLTEGTPYVWRVKGVCGEESSRWGSSMFKTKDDLLVFTTAGNWNVLSNWTDADGNAATALPTANNKVRIDAAVTITNGVVATAKSTIINGGSITIEEGGQLKQGSTVKVTMHKGITGYGAGNEAAAGHYNLIATPHSCSYLEENTLFPYVLNVSAGDNDLYAFDPTQGQAWINYESNSGHSEFHTGDNYGLFNKKGYLYANAADKDLEYVGTVSSSLNNTLTDSYTYNPNSTDPFNGWKLVGNPFTCNSTISFVDGSDAPLGAIFYKMNNSGDGFVAYQNFVVLAPGEGAFIHYTQSGTIKYSSEVSGTPNNAVAETPLPMLPQHGLGNNQIAIVVLADNTNNSSIIDDLNGQIVNVILQGRTLWKDGDWNTLCLPFSMDDTQIAASSLAGAIIKELDTAGSSLDNNGLLTLAFKVPTADTDGNIIKAGVPYIVKWESTGSISNPTFPGVTITATNPIPVTFSNAKGSDCQFVGQFSPFVISDGRNDDSGNPTVNNINEILMMGSGSTIGYSKNPRTLKCFRAHFEIPTTGGEKPVRAFQMDFGSEETGIIPVNGSGVTFNGSDFYTLDGIKLQDKPTKKGVYIKNGKKIVVK